jgi:GT2 family glycosyltransferase
VIGIVIPTVFKAKSELFEALHSVFATARHDFKLYVYKNDYKGFAHACNEGIKAFLQDDEVDVILLLNDDAVLLEAWDDEINYQLFNSPRAGAVCNKGDSRRSHFTFWFAALRKKMIQEVGFLDENFEIGNYEDMDYCARMQQKSWQIALTRFRVAVHPVPSKTLAFMRKEFWHVNEKNRQYYLNKWRGTEWEKLA